MVTLGDSPVIQSAKHRNILVNVGFKEPQPPFDGTEALVNLPTNFTELTSDELHVLHATNTSWLVYAAFQETMAKISLDSYVSDLNTQLAIAFLESSGKTVSERNEQKMLSPEVLDLKQKIKESNSLYQLYKVTRERLESYNVVISRRLTTISSERSYGGV